MTHQTDERRAYPRLYLYALVRYQQEGTEDIEEGVIDNLSLDGFLLWSEQELVVNTRLYLLIDTDEAEVDPVRIPATVLRAQREKRGSRFGYGCRIDGMINLRSWFDLIDQFRARGHPNS